MFTSDERKQIGNFEDDIAEIVDRYLKEGMDIDVMSEILRGEAIREGLYARRAELDAS